MVKRITVVWVSLIACSAMWLMPKASWAETYYDGNLRPQFQFSPQLGWQNDITGLYYANGVYHLHYEANPYADSGKWGGTYWGHATSVDLLHWTQQPESLVPGGAYGSDIWSGTGIVDTNNTSGYGPGGVVPIILIYSDVGSGGWNGNIRLAYSLDGGQSFIAEPRALMSSVPVSVASGTRDPKVFWHTPTSKWIMALYDGVIDNTKGVTFWSSTNLKNWKYLSKFNNAAFYECPDMFQLPVDGNTNNMKWVIKDAANHYWIGAFNGMTFTPDTGSFPKIINLRRGNDPINSQYGYSSYAGQTFGQNTFPTSRVVGMDWSDNWSVNDDVPSTLFKHATTFPTEYKLQTINSTVQLTKMPISEISNLESLVQNTGPIQLTGDLALPSTELFDLSAQFTIGAATTITFKIGGADVFKYDTKTETAQSLGNNLTDGNSSGSPLSLPLVGNRLTVRVLRDRGIYTVFFGQGEHVFTQEYNFANNNIVINSSASVTLNSASLKSVSPIWTGKYQGPARPEGWYKLVSSASGKVLDVPNASKQVNVLLDQWESTRSTGQQWYIQPFVSGDSSLKAKCSYLVLDDTNGSTSNGQQLQQLSWLNTPAQHWRILPAPPNPSLTNGNGVWLRTQASQKCMDLQNGSTSNGAVVQQWDCIGTAAQSWQLLPIFSGTYKIVNRFTGKVLDVTNGSTANGTHIQQWEQMGTDSQKWTISDIGGGSYTLSAKCSGKYLDLPSGDSTNGTYIQQWAYTGTSYQSWQLVPTRDGYYKIVSVSSGKPIEVTGGSTANGTAIQEWAGLEAARQEWRFERT